MPSDGMLCVESSRILNGIIIPIDVGHKCGMVRALR